MNKSYTITMLALRLVLTAALLLITIQGYSQQQEPELQPDLETDRPDQTEAASVVPFKTIQLEAGFYFLKDKIGSTEIKYKAYPTTLIRYGILNWLELRAEGTYQRLIVKNEVSVKEDGFGPLTIGTKVKLWQEKGLRPQAAFMAMVDLPVGSQAFKPDNPEVGLRLMFKNALSDKFDLNYNVAYGWEDGDPLAGYAVSIGTGLTDRITVFGEVFGDKPKGEEAAHSFDTGLLFLIKPNLQFDIAAGKALNDVAPDYFVTTGLSIRLPR